MLGSLARRERRASWIVSSVLLVAAIGFSLWAAARARSEATAIATRNARITAQTTLAPLLVPKDLNAPIVGQRAEELTAGIERAITSVGPVSEVGTVVVAEMSQPLGPIQGEANRPWHRLALALGVVLVGTATLATKSARAPAPAPIPVTVSRPAPTRRTERERRPATEPQYEHPGFRAIEERRQEAERRADTAEEQVHEMQGQVREALNRIREMGAKVTMNENRTAQNDGEMQALREQIRETAERLHQAEVDNAALRERLALRQQELDEARGQLSSTHGGEDAEGLKDRLDAAEARVVELTEAMRKLEAELDYTKSRFRLSMLTAALREFDNDDIQTEEPGHHDPVIVRRASLQPGKVG